VDERETRFRRIQFTMGSAGNQLRVAIARSLFDGRSRIPGTTEPTDAGPTLQVVVTSLPK
jgi:hypothetical protein